LAGGLAALLDDIAAPAKLAASSIDDVGLRLAEQARDIGTLGGVIAWSVNTLLSAIV